MSKHLRSVTVRHALAAQWVLLVAFPLGCTTRNPAFDPGLLADQGTPISDSAAIDQNEEGDLVAPDAPPPPEPIGVDVLLVIDNSGGTSGLQQRFARDIDTLVSTLDGMPGGPDYRIGVITTDLGVGPFAWEACSAEGDEGKLQIRESCPSKPIDGASFLQRIGDEANVRGDLADALSCLVRVGEKGCGFEQPLESMRAALTTANDGFLRPEAALAIVIITDEDDCSAAAGQQIYDPSDESLGPYASYRCFQFGVLCKGIQPPTDEVELSGCAPGQSYLHEVQSRYVASVVALKPPGWVSVLVLAGPALEPVQVVEAKTNQGTYWRLDPSCQNGTVGAHPAFRLRAFAAGFGGSGGFESACQDSYRESFTRLMSRL